MKCNSKHYQNKFSDLFKKDYKIEFIEFHTRCTYKISTECHFNRRHEHHSELPIYFAKEMTMFESGGTITE